MTSPSTQVLHLGLLEAVMDAAPLGVGLFDRELRYLRVNERLATISGLPAGELIGRTLTETAGKLGEDASVEMAEVVRTGRPALDRVVSGELPAGSGRLRHWRVSRVAVRGEDGAVIGVAAFVDELTEQVQAQAQRDALLEAERRLRRRAEFLAQASELLGSTLDYEATLQRVASIAVPDLADWCAIDLLDEGGRIRRLAATHADPDRERYAWELHERYPPDPDALNGVPNVLRTGSTEVFWEISDELLVGVARDEEHLRMIRELGLTGAVIAPLAARGKVFGTISFVWSEGQRSVSADDVDVIEELARRGGMAIDNARLHAEQGRIASVLQRSLLPQHIPYPETIELAARYLPAGEDAEAGGDFYDVIALGDGRYAAVVGDVCGKGPEAAAATALCRHTLRAGALEDHDPPGMLGLLNRALLAYGERNKLVVFTSIAMAVVQPTTDGHLEVELWSGGHPAPLVCRDGRSELVEARGTLVGAMEAPAFERARLTLSPQDVLLLYTDGAIESRVPERSLGEDGLAELVATTPCRPPAKLVEYLERAIRTREQGSPRDDLALVALRAATPAADA